MASSIVVKVKYEDTLRRFNARLHEDRQMDIDIGALRAKICSLFNLTPESDFKLTYVDEDLDVVALVDQDDLRDVIRQGLNPLRINVQLNTAKSCSPNARTSGTSSPNMNTSAADPLKSVRPLREALSKLSAEASSKAASSSRVLADLVDSITKASQSFLNANSSPKSREDATSRKEATQKCDSSFTGKTTLGTSTSGLGEVLDNVDDKTTKCINDDGKKKHGTQGPIFHRGVCCDGCGVLPITGPRFKSKVKEDYDLCKNCFSVEENDGAYMRIDFPAQYRHPWSFKGHPAVDASIASVPAGSLNLNMPPEIMEENKMDVDTMESASCQTIEMEKPLEDEKQSNLSDAGIQDDYQVISACSSSSSPQPIPEEACSLASYPTVEVVVPDTAATSPLVDPSTTNAERVQHDVEVALLKELEDMGFKLVNLNKEVLRRNDYDLEWSLEELCGFSKLDLLVEELQEMGFVDKEKNKKVLTKHNGSLIQAVMDLIADENA